MLKNVLFNIIRQEQREVEERLEEEGRRPAPDLGKLTALRQKAMTLRRELEHFPPEA
ncbi:hypothetical protein [Azospirillum halopraeferens]|uniref:hypothetical protein n=1 Tax=Azospirillum halopraeferens TaxID=34010 RepID=UPI0003FD8970|nr:hypothetical protein [Azospirillum halopraeferens]